MTKVAGIDVSKDSLDVVVLTERQSSAYVQLPNTEAGYGQLVRWLRKHGSKGGAVCLEATGRYGDGVAQALYDAGFRVSVVNPARIRGYADSQLRRNKTDKLDAQLIAAPSSPSRGRRRRLKSASCKAWCATWPTWRKRANN